MASQSIHKKIKFLLKFNIIDEVPLHYVLITLKLVKNVR